MRVAIAGGSGYLGGALTTLLLARGDDVVWLSRRPGRVTPPAGLCREVAFDHADPRGPWASALGEVDAVANLSGHPIAARWNERVKHAIVASRVDLTRDLVSAMATLAETGSPIPRVLVNASGMGIYGDRGDAVLAECEPPGGDWLSQVAAAWEGEALKAEALGVRVALLRTGLVLGDEGFLPRIVLPMRLFVGGPVGSGRQWLSWIHWRDVARLYAHALDSDDVSGPLNASSPEPVRMADFSRQLGRVLHRPSWFSVPGFVLRPVLGEVAPYTLMSQRASADKALDSGFSYRFPDLGAALSDLLGP